MHKKDCEMIEELEISKIKESFVLFANNMLFL